MIRDLLANTLNALEEVTVVSTEPTLDGEGGHGQRGDIKLLANGTEFVIDATVACPATRHMTRTHHTGMVPGAAGGKSVQKLVQKPWNLLKNAFLCVEIDFLRIFSKIVLFLKYGYNMANN